MPEAYTTFFSVSAGAGATLLGLIFVAVSISPEKTVGKSASIERSLQADSAFTALVNAFFVSLTAIPPTGGVGWGALLLSIFALQSTFRSAFKIFGEIHGWLNLARRLFLVLIAFGVYGLELYASISLINSPNNPNSLATLTSLVSSIYGIGIIRAWELFGTDREFFFRIFSLVESLRLNFISSKSKQEVPGKAAPVTEASRPETKEETGLEKEKPAQSNLSTPNVTDKSE